MIRICYSMCGMYGMYGMYGMIGSCSVLLLVGFVLSFVVSSSIVVLPVVAVLLLVVPFVS